MCCALVTRDVVYPRQRQAHPTVHSVSSSGVPLVVRQRSRGAPTLGGGPGGQPAPTGPPPGRPGDTGPRGGNFSVLPPIKDSGRKKEQDFGLSELDDISLKNEVIRKVKELPERGLQGLLINLRAQDRDRDGILSTDTVKGTLNKFQLHLTDNGLKNICKKFGEAGDRVPMVRYEEMMTYLTKSRMEALKPPPPMINQRSVGVTGGKQQPPQPRKVNLRNTVLFSDRDEGKLMADMERQLKDKPVNMADLRRTMYDLDRDRNDFLSGQQVQIALSKCGFHLTPDVKARLLLATDRTGAGLYKIETIMNYLTRVIPESHNTIVMGNNHNPRHPRVGQLPAFQNQPTLNTPWDNNPQQRLQTQTEFLPDEGFIEDGEGIREEQLPLQPEPQAMALSPVPPMEDPEPAFDIQKWTNDYQYLAQAVYSADEDQSGFMPADEVQHVAATYNLVYNLQISESTFQSALSSSIDPNYGEVNLEYFIALLQDLHFRELQNY
ncbi:uncharacterized protein LOC121877608 isoform X2 [Homarus americanus]|uniref:uncharacterized protein LOC121877608 isoform X2 n=1 Tax=Homarus americanus TaxID=6706 RepID=UPI001C438BB1|nr:uncharacterized protein LOC121877608 isoform X2 [Homarus americanus]